MNDVMMQFVDDCQLHPYPVSYQVTKIADKIGRVPINEYPTCILLQELVKGITTTYEREEKSLRPLAKQVLQPVED